MLDEALHKLLAPKKKQYPCHVNRISQLDDPCLRRLYYRRTAWDKTPETNDGLQGIFETGNVLEPLIERIVSELGEVAEPQFRIVGTQTPTKDSLMDKFQISGSIDGFWQTKENGQWQTKGVVDIKTANPHIFDGLSNYESLSKYPWTRKYRGQLMLYALAHNLDKCVLLFVNKTNLFQMKTIEFDLDYDYAESLLQKAKAVNEAIESGNAPDKLNDPDECPRCDFCAICCPEYEIGGNLEISTDEELEGILLRLKELAPQQIEIKGLEKRRDQLLVKGKDLVVGKFMILWQLIKGNRKPSLGGPYEQWRKKIIYQD